ncbi:hypothetical protein [Anaerocolumna sp. MB42-C2]|uniref:hypothetical protein n=1 Tax=Anaerocolumna sp. MB42-C2 TaxID=3070997 RepID=UPI0027DF9390|nr:hypothetical protein [Anaerocolumna sp. MB42-C2]WMJ89954.1 hypothetical protein RBU59_10640 [Anaerocolumna sp. MB42-C2]
MNSKLKKAIKCSYEIPKPKRKEEFLSNLPYPKTRGQDFLRSQVGYIHKRVWVTSFILFILILVFCHSFKKDDLRILMAVSAMIPILTSVTVTEIIRSSVFGMDELEMTTRYNLRSLVLARMGILGMGNMLLLLLTIPVLSIRIEIESVWIGVYLLGPYLLTCFISFALINRFRSNEITYYCAGAAVLVWCLELLLNYSRLTIYEPRYISLWLAILALLLIAFSKELHKYIKNTEELLWNSSLTV